MRPRDARPRASDPDANAWHRRSEAGGCAGPTAHGAERPRVRQTGPGSTASTATRREPSGASVRHCCGRLGRRLRSYSCKKGASTSKGRLNVEGGAPSPQLPHSLPLRTGALRAIAGRCRWRLQASGPQMLCPKRNIWRISEQESVRCPTLETGLNFPKLSEPGRATVERQLHSDTRRTRRDAIDPQLQWARRAPCSAAIRTPCMPEHPPEPRCDRNHGQWTPSRWRSRLQEKISFARS